MKAGIVLDTWKYDIFKRHLLSNGYKYTKPAAQVPDTLTLIVETNNPEAPKAVLEAANSEANFTRNPNENNTH